MTQRMIEITSPLFISEEALGGTTDLHTVFAKQQPLALEIGCGIGDFVAQRAAQQPDVNFFAIDIYNKGCLKTCKKSEAAQHQNVRVSRIEARFLLTRHVQPNSLAAVYINCPDPWPKKRHRDRRLVNTEFLTRLLYYLKPGGELFFSTDFADYAEQVAELIPEVEGYTNCQQAPYSHSLQGYPISKYMKRFLDMGQPIHYIHYRKREDFQFEKNQMPEIVKGFRVRWGKAENE